MDSSKATWGPLGAILATILLFFVSQAMAIFLLLAAILAFGGGAPVDVVARRPEFIFLGNIFAGGCLLGLLYGFLKLKKSSFAALGLGGFKPIHAAYALAGYIIYFVSFLAINMAVNKYAPHWQDQNQELGFSRSSEGPVLALIFLSLVIIPPLVEELLFRGVLFGGLRRRLSFIWSALVTSVLFAVVHLAGGETSALLWIAALDTFLLSLVLCYLRERSGSLWPPILLHGLKNLIAFTVIFILRAG